MSDKEYFGSYFTGLFEAVGSISIPLGNKKYPHIGLYFKNNNKALVEAIKDRIGHGSIYERKNRDLLSYEIFNKEGILKFIEITRGYYRTPKINRYNDMIEYLNTYKNQKISSSSLNTNSFNEDAWLSGYLESTGTFEIVTKTLSRRYYFDPKFKLIHRKLDQYNNSFEPFLQTLADFLHTPLQETTMNNNQHFLIRIFHSTYYLVNYLNNYPLYGSREYTFDIFKCVYDLWADPELTNTFFRDKTQEEYIQSIETLSS